AVEVVAAVPRVRDSAPALIELADDRSDRATTFVQHVQRQRLPPPEDERDHSDVPGALADRREHVVDTCARNRAALELEQLGDGESGRGRAEQDEDDQELGPPRQRAEVTDALRRGSARTVPPARTRSSRRRSRLPREWLARSAGAGSRAAPSCSART